MVAPQLYSGWEPTNFPPAISTNVRISSQIFDFSQKFSQIFSSILPNFCKISGQYLLPVPNNWINQGHPSKKLVFLGNIIWHWGYNYFTHRNARVTKLWSHDHKIKCYWWRHGHKLWRHNFYIKIHFADIIKIWIMSVKTTFKDSNKVKRTRNYVLKCNLCLYFLI